MSRSTCFFLAVALSALIGPALANTIDVRKIQKLVESKGYTFIAYASGLTEVSPGFHVFGALIDGSERKGDRESVILLFGNDTVVPIADPGIAGDGLSIDALDLNNDGVMDLIAIEYFEPNLFVRVFLGEAVDKYREVLRAYSTNRPKTLENALFGADGKDWAKPLILTDDPYGLGGHVDLVVPSLYVYDGDRYIRQDNGCSSPRQGPGSRWIGR